MFVVPNKNILLIIALASILQLLLASPALCEPRVEKKEKLDRYENMIHRGKAPAVLPQLERFTREHPHSERGWLLLNKAYLDVDTDGQGLRLAVSSMKQAVALNRASSTLNKQLAELYARSGQFKLALKWMDNALLCVPPDPFIYKSRARIYSEIKRDKEAVADFERFAQLLPQKALEPDNMELGALCYQRNGQVDKAIKIYDKLWAGNKSLAWPLKKAACYAQVGKDKEAIDVYSLVIKESPNDEIALLERGKLRAKLGQSKEAIRDFSAALETTPTSSIYLERAKVYDKLGKPELARRDREKASASNDGW